MDYMDMDLSSPANQRRSDSYDKPQVKRLGTFRELTRSGTSLDILLGTPNANGCVVGSSSCPTTTTV